MTPLTLKDQFLQALLVSTLYKSLNQEEQNELTKAYENVSDDQYREALAELGRTENALKQMGTEAKEKTEQMKKAAQEIKLAYHRLKRLDAEDKSDREQAVSAKAADELLTASLQTEKESTPKKKGFFSFLK
jgi:hypothetical protein